jgi:hypothetical protein
LSLVGDHRFRWAEEADFLQWGENRCTPMVWVCSPYNEVIIECDWLDLFRIEGYWWFCAETADRGGRNTRKNLKRFSFLRGSNVGSGVFGHNPPL